MVHTSAGASSAISVFFLLVLQKAGQISGHKQQCSIPEEHGEGVYADHVVGVAVGEEELVRRHHPPLRLQAVEPEGPRSQIKRYPVFLKRVNLQMTMERTNDLDKEEVVQI